MTVELAEHTTHAALVAAREAAVAAGLPYAGGISPQDAWALFSAGEAVLVDVRSPDEYTGKVIHMVNYPQEGATRGGHIPGARSIPWAKAAREDGTFKSAADSASLTGCMAEPMSAIRGPSFCFTFNSHPTAPGTKSPSVSHSAPQPYLSV